ncbi:MAG: hypothetical protein HYU53_16810 [Acidobacteria bacterium]|nr:hypothetical protein [Acidobacteriota bacterium]
MDMTLPERVLEAGRAVLAAERDSLARTLGAFVSTFVGRPYLAGPATLEGVGGRQSAPFACVVFTLSLENFREGYARIAGAKRLWQETPRSGDAGRRSELLGVILARRSQLNLEAVAEEMQRLNTEMPATLWPDMVAVADTGLVQYSAQFPGENVTGDFLLPGETLSYAAPMYIVMVMKPSGAATLNRILSFVVGHLAARRAAVGDVASLSRAGCSQERPRAPAGAADFVRVADHRSRFPGHAGAVSPAIEHGGAAG